MEFAGWVRGAGDLLEIVRTVSRIPTLSEVTVLGLIVLIRTFLSFTLEVELENRWPWQRRRPRIAERDAHPRSGPVSSAPP